MKSRAEEGTAPRGLTELTEEGRAAEEGQAVQAGKAQVRANGTARVQGAGWSSRSRSGDAAPSCGGPAHCHRLTATGGQLHPPARAEAERPGEGVPVRSQERGSGWRSCPCLDSEGRRVTEATPAGPGGCGRGCGVCSWWDSPSPSDFSPPLGPDGGESPARRSQSQAARRRCGTGTVGSRLVRTASRGFTDLLNFPVVNTHKR